MKAVKSKQKQDKAANPAEANKMWGGRFVEKPSDLMQKINASIDFDWKLYEHDIKASIVHVLMLSKCEILSKGDAIKIAVGLDQILEEIRHGHFIFKRELEDIHMNIEGRLAEIIGEETAGKLHTARSRNDQVATSFRLFLRDAVDNIENDMLLLIDSLLLRAEEGAGIVMPGFTHLQPAQPVTFGHHMLAYVEMLGRDLGRLRDCRKRMNESPLGAAALAGTSFPINRMMTAAELGFFKPMSNSIDAVSDRDFALEFLSFASICAVHLSRLAEEIVIWSTPQFSFVKLSDSFSTGSSIMPQKRNPDAAELVRGKSGRIFGSLQTLLVALKGLPLAYSKDMQEDKEPVFDAVETLSTCLQAMSGMVSDLHIMADNMNAQAANGFTTATDLADWLVRELGMPFRLAHQVTGKIVKLAEDRGVPLDKLTLKEMKSVDPRIDDSIFSVLSTESSVSSRKSLGGTAPENVRKEIKRAYKRFT
jgi:argininosuccinate lyase